MAKEFLLGKSIAETSGWMKLDMVYKRFKNRNIRIGKGCMDLSFAPYPIWPKLYVRLGLSCSYD
jgi:hypothetical protein